ncbi:arylsulfatase [Verrucomicrobiaceae bacterium N1E253]|uniref:Arylsulfatase n=1 Tax=Oceaniferula marina TaxID=2748318 RepID=A0A851GN00_9BACT|nr:arylsulfatase [Oceaniferula marina]NWK55494.1 arylsulfatase [Oceaniferula marina]
MRVLLCSAYFCFLLASAWGGQRSPNILFVYLDDLGYGDVSCYNPESKIQTPHMDRLAKEGIRFTDAHTPAAICGPSRYGVMTGRYPWRRGKDGLGNGAKFRDTFIEHGRLTLASLLKKKGYNTAQIGKWGMRHHYSKALKPGAKPGTRDAYDFPRKRLLGSQRFGFDYSWCMTHLFPLDGEKQISVFCKHQMENGLPVDAKLKHSNARNWLPDSAKKVVEYIEAYAQKEKVNQFGIQPKHPFFIYWDPPSPHEPIVPHSRFLGKSGAGAYGDFIVEIDHYLGEVLKALDRHELSENTLVILSSDNGPEKSAYSRIKQYQHDSMGGLRGVKRDLWEGGHRVPFILRWPGRIKAGGTEGGLVCLTDILATFADITEQALPQDAGEDSISLLPQLYGQTGSKQVRSHVIHHSHRGHYALRYGDWLFIDAKTGDVSGEPKWFSKDRGVQHHQHQAALYHLKDDKKQSTNLYGSHPEKARQMKQKLNQLKAKPLSRN